MSSRKDDSHEGNQDEKSVSTLSLCFSYSAQGNLAI